MDTYEKPFRAICGNEVGILLYSEAGYSQCCQVVLFYIIRKYMKTTISIIVGLIIITTVMFAQNADKEKDKIGNTIDYIKKETLGGKLDFTSVLKGSDNFPIDHKGVRFNRNDYYVFLWGEAISDLGLKSSEEAIGLWEEIQGKKLTGPQRTALRIGFEKRIK